MTNDKSRGTSTDPPRRPYWLVGLVLFGLVVVLLVGAFLLDKQFRPSVGVESATGPVPTAMPAVDSQLAKEVASAPTAVATTAPTPAAPVGSRVAATPLEREIEDTYYKYLQVYSQAVLDLDASHLQEVLDGKALQLVTDEVNVLKAQGRPGKIIEDERAIAFLRVSETSATLLDQYVSRSVYLDPETREPLPRTSPPTRTRQSYEFRKINGAWKIVDGTRAVLEEGSR